MEKIILKAQNEEELKNMISRSLTLKEDETYQVKVLKYPKKILFVNIKGEYEIEIVKKSELKTNKTETQELKIQNKNKDVKKDIKNYSLQKENNKNSNNKKNYRNGNFENDENHSDMNIDKIRGFFKEFIVSVSLDIKIVNIKKENNGKYLVILDGKDMRFLIGEKGSALNSLEFDKHN